MEPQVIRFDGDNNIIFTISDDGISYFWKICHLTSVDKKWYRHNKESLSLSPATDGKLYSLEEIMSLVSLELKKEIIYDIHILDSADYKYIINALNELEK